jgi:hypothetical protein
MKPGSGHASFLTIPRDYFFPFGDHLGTTVFTVVYYFFTPNFKVNYKGIAHFWFPLAF